jgi:hypothetical protein
MYLYYIIPLDWRYQEQSFMNGPSIVSYIFFFFIDVLARRNWDSTFYWYSEENFYCNIELYLGLLYCHSH